MGDNSGKQCNPGRIAKSLLVGVDPGRAGGVGSRIIRIIRSDQLADGVVLLGDGRQVILVDADDVATVVVGVDQVTASD